MLNKLITISNKLDSLGLTKEADLLDKIIFKIANNISESSDQNSAATYIAVANYISNSLDSYEKNYTVAQDYNYDGQDFVSNMSFYIKLTTKEELKSETAYKQLFKEIPKTFLDYNSFRRAMEGLSIIFMDSTEAPDKRAADMNDNGLMRIFIKDLQEKYNKGKIALLVSDFFKDPASKETIYHEVTHYLNYIRSGIGAYGRASGGLGKYEVDNPLYINNTEEIQARVMSILSDPGIEFSSELREAIRANDPNAYISFLLPKIKYWGQYNQENKLRVINRIHKDFLERQAAEKKLRASPQPETEIL
jgi:hypothetical protein